MRKYKLMNHTRQIPFPGDRLQLHTRTRTHIHKISLVWWPKSWKTVETLKKSSKHSCGCSSKTNIQVLRNGLKQKFWFFISVAEHAGALEHLNSHHDIDYPATYTKKSNHASAFYKQRNAKDRGLYIRTISFHLKLISHTDHQFNNTTCLWIGTLYA